MLQQKFQDMQEKLKHEKVVGVSGGGLVTLTLNGEHEMTELKILPECVDPEDVEGLEDLVRAAYHDALKKLEKSSSSGMGMEGFPGFGF